MLTGHNTLYRGHCSYVLQCEREEVENISHMVSSLEQALQMEEFHEGAGVPFTFSDISGRLHILPHWLFEPVGPGGASGPECDCAQGGLAASSVASPPPPLAVVASCAPPTLCPLAPHPPGRA